MSICCQHMAGVLVGQIIRASSYAVTVAVICRLDLIYDAKILLYT